MGQNASAQWVGFEGVVGGEESHETACECPVGGAWGCGWGRGGASVSRDSMRVPSGWGLGVWVGGEEEHRSHGTACECPVGGAWGGEEEHQSHGTACECPVGEGEEEH